APIDVPVHDGNGRLGEDAEGRRHDLHLPRPKLIERQVSFIFPCEQHVADTALNEGRSRAAGTRVEDRDIAEQPTDEVLRRRLAAFGLPERIAPGREIVPAGAPRSLRVRGDDLNASLYQVIPALDVLRIPLSHEE